MDEEVVRMAWEHRKNTASGSMMALRLVMISRCDYDLLSFLFISYCLFIIIIIIIIPQQRKLMGSSAQICSGVCWCRRQSGSTRFRKVPEKVPLFRKALVQSRARFNEVPEKVPEGFGGEPGQVQRGSGEGSGEGSGRSWCKAGPGSTRLQVGSGAISGVCRRAVRSSFSKFRTTKSVKINYCCCWGYHWSLFFIITIC